MKCILLSIFRDEASSPTDVAVLEEVVIELREHREQYKYEVLYANMAHLTVEGVGTKEVHDYLQDWARKRYHTRLSWRK